jgi:phospholipase/carboxylesterase
VGLHNDLIIGPPGAAELLLLFRGAGSSAANLRPLGEVLAARRPGAWLVIVQAPCRSALTPGWQWFSVQGVMEDNRPGRVAAASPMFPRSID